MGIDPFEVAANESLTPPDSPIDRLVNDDPNLKDIDVKNISKDTTSPTATPLNSDDEVDEGITQSRSAQQPLQDDTPLRKMTKDEEEENMDVELTKYNTVDPDKVERFTTILSQLTPDQMNRYESFRRSGFQKANMRRVLQSIAGCPISLPMTIVMSGVAKTYVGELVETSRVVMTERNETGPIRPCHIREAYRRLKLEGKVPKRSRPRLFM
eukprot:TRINITY_DN5379_c0_g1_i1.p1 TRINITY_DN5379_c0_g1~~TRINITY_DN5379_c0_g1_i1.p1  ORF type:complete len:212 (+),score=46.51 TRINITY_DN5379_c0_g1_i1:362-997(+)